MSKAILFSNGYFQPLDNEGNVVPNGTLTIRISSTGALAPVYKDSNMTITQANPVTLDNAGKAEVFLPPDVTYDIELKDALNATVWTISDYSISGYAETLYAQNITALKNLTINISAPVLAKLEYHTTSAAGGGGMFVWDNSSTEADDNGTIIESNTTSTGRWKRIYTGAVKPSWFGAIGDGNTDDTTALRTAFTFPEIDLEDKTYRITAYIDGRGDKLIHSDNATIYISGTDYTQYNFGSYTAALFLGHNSTNPFVFQKYLKAPTCTAANDFYVETQAPIPDYGIKKILSTAVAATADGTLYQVGLSGRIVSGNTFTAYKYYLDKKTDRAFMATGSTDPTFIVNTAKVVVDGTIVFSVSRSTFYHDNEYVLGVVIVGAEESDLSFHFDYFSPSFGMAKGLFYSKLKLTGYTHVETLTGYDSSFAIKDSAHLDVEVDLSTYSMGLFIGSDETACNDINLKGNIRRAYNNSAHYIEALKVENLIDFNFDIDIEGRITFAEVLHGTITGKVVWNETSYDAVSLDKLDDIKFKHFAFIAPNMTSSHNAIVATTVEDVISCEDCYFNVSAGNIKLTQDDGLLINPTIATDYGNPTIIEAGSVSNISETIHLLNNPYSLNVTYNEMRNFFGVTKLYISNTGGVTNETFIITPSMVGLSTFNQKAGLFYIQTIENCTGNASNVDPSQDKFYYDQPNDQYILTRVYSSATTTCSVYIYVGLVL